MKEPKKKPKVRLKARWGITGDGAEWSVAVSKEGEKRFSRVARSRATNISFARGEALRTLALVEQTARALGFDVETVDTGGL